MSILLDSLRKSEAQRKAGDAPTIYSTQEYGDAGAAGSRWVFWLLLALTAAAIVWFGWKQYSFPGAAEATVQVPAEQVPDSGNTSPRTVVPRRDVDGEAPSSARTPVEQIRRTANSAEPPAVDTAADGDADMITPAERIADFEAENDVASSLVESEDQATSESAEAIDNIEMALLEESRDEDISENISSPDRPLGSRLSQTDPPQNEPLSYWQLEQGLRNTLPEFKITVLVYAEAPENRFLLMNGERLREQDEFEGVTLEEIRRDGAVFSYQSYRFLVRN